MYNDDINKNYGIVVATTSINSGPNADCQLLQQIIMVIFYGIIHIMHLVIIKK